jgi:hypothetical protein
MHQLPTFWNWALRLPHRLANILIRALAQRNWAFGSGGERFLHTEEVTSSNLVTPTRFLGSSTAEPSAVNRVVVGSNPTRGARTFKDPRDIVLAGPFLYNVLIQRTGLSFARMSAPSAIHASVYVETALGFAGRLVIQFAVVKPLLGIRRAVVVKPPLGIRRAVTIALSHTGMTSGNRCKKKEPGRGLFNLWPGEMFWWAQQGSNLQPRDYESPAPPLSYRPVMGIIHDGRCRPV